MAENEKKELAAESVKPADKQDKAKKKNPSLFSKISAWFRSCKSEMKKIVWATPKSVLNNFVLVAVTVVVLSAAIAIVDFLFLKSINALAMIF